MKIIIIAKCCKIKIKDKYLFNFKGVYCGVYIKKILIETSRDLTIGYYYIIKVNRLKISSSILICLDASIEVLNN